MHKDIYGYWIKFKLRPKGSTHEVRAGNEREAVKGVVWTA